MEVVNTLGRRKTAVARAYVQKGSGEIIINNKDYKAYFTTSVLQYKINQAGTGPIPAETDMVKVYYKGTLEDGREFDATTEGNPAQFRVNGVIRGWTEALMLMPVGSKWKLFISVAF